MNYAIQFKTTSYPFLHVTPRKKTLKHQLFTVTQGNVLVKLGKNEFLVESGRTFWIPQGCLCSISTFPNTEVTNVDFSIRLQDKFVEKAGFVKTSALLNALLEKLSSVDAQSELAQDLLNVVKHESLELKPSLSMNKTAEQVNEWKANQPSELSKEIQLALLVREARKQKLSGIKTEKTVEELFAGNIEQFQQLTQLVLGETL